MITTGSFKTDVGWLGSPTQAALRVGIGTTDATSRPEEMKTFLIMRESANCKVKNAKCKMVGSFGGDSTRMRHVGWSGGWGRRAHKRSLGRRAPSAGKLGVHLGSNPGTPTLKLSCAKARVSIFSRCLSSLPVFQRQNRPYRGVRSIRRRSQKIAQFMRAA